MLLLNNNHDALMTTPKELYDFYSQEGQTLRSTGKHFGLSHWTVRKRIVDAGYALKPVGNPNFEEVEEALSEVVQGRVEAEIKDWLKDQPEGESYHVREALRRYIASFEGN